ncbi:hypothetical protein [Streptomyces sp.]|uniref:hypothetical protein n=1 Tax=Streptomyces sp. TaxID=1931 RepID=UPI002D782178|nr:hypothetical protein [Streptomyces sp.]HET6353958.1 hypothetical protein [Streptomyces sp.]
MKTAPGRCARRGREWGCELVLRGLDENAVAELVHRATGEQPRLPVVQRLLCPPLAAALQQQLAALPAPARALTEAAAVLSVRAHYARLDNWRAWTPRPPPCSRRSRHS